jgi:hypothetical protein
MSSVLPYSPVTSRTIPAQVPGRNLRAVSFAQKFESEPFGIGETERKAQAQAVTKRHQRHHWGMWAAELLMWMGLPLMLGGHHNMASMNQSNQPPAIHSQHSGMQPGTPEWDEMCKMPGMESMCGAPPSVQKADDPFRSVSNWVTDPMNLMLLSMLPMYLMSLGHLAGSIKRRLAIDPNFKLNQKAVITLMNEMNAELAHQNQPYRLVKIDGARKEVRVSNQKSQEWLTQANQDVLNPILGLDAELTPENLVRLTAEQGNFLSKKDFNKAVKRAQELLLSLNLELVSVNKTV